MKRRWLSNRAVGYLGAAIFIAVLSLIGVEAIIGAFLALLLAHLAYRRRHGKWFDFEPGD